MSQQIRTVAVIGSGTMGAGIAEVAAMAGQQVLLHDISAEAMSRAIAALRSRLEARVAKGKLSAEACERGLARIVPVTDIAAIAAADLVIEAAAENLDIKKALFTQLGEICQPQALLTSNTSSISITAIAAGVKHPERLAGLHFFNPAPVMKLVEVVSGVATSDEVVTQLSQCVLAWGKQPVHCQSTPGFIVNRVARPYYAEAWRALEEQVAAPEVIDTALREAGRFPMGPLALTDLIGQDVNFAVTCSVFNAFWQERRFLPSLVQQELVLAGRYGKKTGQGVYRWPEGAAEVAFYPDVPAHCKAAQTNKERDVVTLDDVLLLETTGETAQAAATRLQRPVVVMDRSESDVVVIAAAASNRLEESEKAIHWLQQQGKKVLLVADYPGLLVWRTVAMLVNEALDALQKGVASEADINIAMRLGVNYPRGPLQWGELLGWQRVLEVLENLQRHYGEERYRPCSLLRQRALLESSYES